MLIAEESILYFRPGESATAARLSPSQDRASSALIEALPAGNVFVLRVNAGLGRTTILRHVHTFVGGAFRGIRDFTDALIVRRPDAIEQAFLEMIEEALANHETVILDDLHLLSAITNDFRYTRRRLLDAALEAVLTVAVASGRKIVFGTDQSILPPALWSRATVFKLLELKPEDYRDLARPHLGRQTAGQLDFTKIHRAAPGLSAYQLQRACIRLSGESALTAERFIADLNEHDLASNVELAEVQAVDWKVLKGMDDVISLLEMKIALPFENAALAAELQLKPKRGVLLAGPPGTGKTTIGRALAHRLRGKFFLIDGTVIAGSCDFHDAVAEIFEAAKKNAPAVVFIDDCDVIFEDNSKGFYRYLLTMLDGLESASAERVCVMMTAMEVGSLPPALLRSGRIELWLETRLPDEPARRDILRARLAHLPEPLASVDVAMLASASAHLTGADLKAVVEDGKLAYAHEHLNGGFTRAIESYFLDAIEELRENRRRYRRSKPPSLTEPLQLGFSSVG